MTRKLQIQYQHCLRIKVRERWNTGKPIWTFVWTTDSTDEISAHTHTHTHTPIKRLMALFPGLPRWAGTRNVKPIWILLKQETVSGSGISWAVGKSASRSRQITMPVPRQVSLQAGCPSCRPTNSVKALKAKDEISAWNINTQQLTVTTGSNHVNRNQAK